LQLFDKGEFRVVALDAERLPALRQLAAVLQSLLDCAGIQTSSHSLINFFVATVPNFEANRSNF
jgi:hypothetical protein